MIAIQDAEADVRAFMSQGGYDLPVLLDPPGSIASAYRVSAVPTAVIIDADGRVANIKVGQTTAAELESLLAPLR